MLAKSDDFKQHQRVKQQGDALNVMWFSSIGFLVMLVYADFMVAMTKNTKVPGALLDITPVVLQPLLNPGPHPRDPV